MTAERAFVAATAAKPRLAGWPGASTGPMPAVEAGTIGCPSQAIRPVVGRCGAVHPRPGARMHRSALPVIVRPY